MEPDVEKSHTIAAMHAHRRGSVQCVVSTGAAAAAQAQGTAPAAPAAPVATVTPRTSNLSETSSNGVCATRVGRSPSSLPPRTISDTSVVSATLLSSIDVFGFHQGGQFVHWVS